MKQCVLFGDGGGGVVSPHPTPASLRLHPRAVTDPCPGAPRPFIGAVSEATGPFRCDVCGNPGLPPGFVVQVGICRAHLGCGQSYPLAKRRG